jgi:hypothetical protein
MASLAEQLVKYYKSHHIIIPYMLGITLWFTILIRTIDSKECSFEEREKDPIKCTASTYILATGIVMLVFLGMGLCGCMVAHTLHKYGIAALISIIGPMFGLWLHASFANRLTADDGILAYVIGWVCFMIISISQLTKYDWNKKIYLDTSPPIDDDDDDNKSQNGKPLLP